MARRPKDDICPICGAPSAPDTRPFCSPRCRMRDLAHWVGADEPYVIPGAPLSPGGAIMSDEERALLEEAEAEGAASPRGNVIRADFRRRRRFDRDDEDD